MTTALKKGLRYEEEVLGVLDRWSKDRGFSLVPKPWFRFGGRWLSPDALVFHPPTNSFLLVEIKFRHNPEAYRQLRQVYLPALSAALPSWRAVPLIICRWHSVHDPMPERYRLEGSPEDLLKEPGRARGLISVHICSVPKTSYFSGGETLSLGAA